MKHKPFSTHLLAGEHVAGRSLDSLELEAARRALALLKNRLGSRAMSALLQYDVEETDRLWEAWAAESNGEWRTMSFTMEVHGLPLAYWLQWIRANFDQESMHFAVHPEHYAWTRADLVDPDAGPDHFMVIEPMGDHMLRGYARLLDWEGQEAYADPDFPVRLALAGYTRNGVMVARSLSQYRETDDGFVFKMVAMKPVKVPATMIPSNQEHGYLEFNRYMECARKSWEQERDATAFFPIQDPR